MKGRTPIDLMRSDVGDDKLALEVEFNQLVGEDACEKVVEQKRT